MTQQTLPSRKRLGKKNCYQSELNIYDLIRFYHKRYGTPKVTGVSDSVFRKVIDEFNYYLSEQLIKGERIILPYNLGTLEILKRKQKFILEDNKLVTDLLMIDWSKTWEYWKKNSKAAEQKKLIYHDNEHTDNFRYKFSWDKYGINSTKIKMYSFHPSRILSRRLAEHLLDPESIKNYAVKC